MLTLKMADAVSQRVRITYYTDPLCIASWAMEDSWQRLIHYFRDNISYQYCMGGFISDCKQFDEHYHSVAKQAKVQPTWNEDPPSSSYPACLAVKAASLQSQQATEHYLRSLRKALITEGRNISRTEILFDVARQVSQEFPGYFDLQQFSADFDSKVNRLTLQEDLKKVRRNAIRHFPTMTFTLNGKGILLSGIKSYETLADALKQMLKTNP